MKRLRLIITLVIIVFVVAIVIWRVGFYSPETERAESGVEPKVVTEPNKPAEPQKPSDANKPEMAVDVNERSRRERWPGRLADVGERRGPGRRPRRLRDVNEPIGRQRPIGRIAEANEPNKPADQNEPMEALNLKEVQMKDIIQKLAEWTGKVIIPDDEVMKQKITIYAPEKLPRNQALSIIYAALRAKGFVAEQTDDRIFLKPIAKAKLGPVLTVPPDLPLAAIENKSRIVQKFFKLKNYSPTRMGDIVLPLIGEHGYVSADENTGNLLVIDTVENLMRIQRIITQFDVPEAGETVTEIFTVRYGDPAEIVQLLRMLLSDEGSASARGSSRSIRDSRGRSRPSSRSRPGSSSSPSGASSSKPSAAATSVVIGPTQMPIVLIPEPRRKWIIARASPEDMKQIAEWIDRLDRKEPLESEYETISVTYADVSEVASRLNQWLQERPGTELKASVLVQPLTQARQIMIFGRKDMREMVKKLILEVDIPPGDFEQKVFKLKHADPDQIKKNLDELYGEDVPMRDTYYYYRYGAGSRRTVADVVKVISFPTMQQVTVIASPEKMRKIEEQIKDWDVPLDVEQVKPRIIELRNSDPVKMADLLTTLFSEEAGRGDDLLRLIFYPYSSQESKRKIVGPLYGQLTFEPVPGTRKIIVISKIPEAYEVIEQFIRDLDKREMAEVPKVITLKYADPEDLSVRLNAIFNEPGVAAPIWFSETGLSEYSMEETEEKTTGSSETGSTAEGQYTPPWSKARPKPDEMPISNVIGRIRFIPHPHSKSILVLAPPEFMDSIEEMIKELDVPGKQVMIKAVIVEVDHRSMTSLGLQLSSDEFRWAALGNENAVTALAQLSFLETHGSLTLDAGTNVTALIEFLVKNINAKILNQQTLWTKDNEKAEFFKGDSVAFLKGSTISPEGRVTSQNVEFEKVGMVLRARPSITPEKNVDMVINVLLWQLSSESVNNQPVRKGMETQTNMIVQDGQTIMLGGILFQEDSTIERKLPLLGDLPVVGGLFRHNETVQVNNEMLVFITPYVIDEPGKMSPETIEELERPKEKLKKVQEQLGTILDRNE